VLNLNDIDFEILSHNTTPVVSVQREDTVFSTTSLDVLYEKVSSPSKSVMPKSSDKKVNDDDRIKFYSKLLKRPSFSTSDKYLSIRSRSMASINDLKLNKLNNKSTILKSPLPASSSNMNNGRKTSNSYDIIKNKQIQVKKHEMVDRNRMKIITKLPIIDKASAIATYKISTSSALSRRSRSVSIVSVGRTDNDLSRKNIISPNKERNHDSIKKVNCTLKASEARTSRTSSPDRVEKLKVTKENSPNNKSKTDDKYKKFKAAVEVNKKSPVNKKVTVTENNDISNKKILTSPQGLSTEYSVISPRHKVTLDRVGSSNELKSLSPTVKEKRVVMMTTNKVVNDQRRDIYTTPSSEKRLRERSKITNSNSVERSKSSIPTVSPSNPIIDIDFTTNPLS
jgi:hypothetical protein